MISKVFTVYDSKLEAYMQPFFMQTKGAALRAWESTVNDPSSQFNKHPSDFTLFEIGEYNDSTGQIIMNEVKQPLGTAIEFLKSSKLTSIGEHQ